MFSIPLLDFRQAWQEAQHQMRDMSGGERFWFWFWLAGPLIFLIERSPADFWIVAVDIAFIWHCVRTHNWQWMRQIWVRATLLFWGVCLLSAALSALPQHALIEAIGWIRFPLYAAAAQVWFGHLRAFRLLMLAAMFIGMMIMSGILTAEIILEPKSRLEWPYGDLVPGNYLAKATLPAFIVLSAVWLSKERFSRLPLLGVLIYTLSMSIMTGERMNLLIRSCAAGLAGLSWRPAIKMLGLGTVLVTIVFGALLLYSDSVGKRFGASFFEQNPINIDTSPYWAVWRTGIQGFVAEPIIGIGPGNIRYLCDDLPQIDLPGYSDCDNHPHHYYFQMLGETGAIGLFFGVIMIGAIIHCCWQARRHNVSDKLTCPMAATAFVIPFAFFWPIQSTADFFGQWNNLFMWISLGFAIMQNQSWRDIGVK